MTAQEPQEPLVDLSGVWSATSDALTAYRLPDGVTLTTEASASTVAKWLGTTQAQISDGWQYTQFTWHGPTPEQANKNTRNIQVWQVLALMEMGLIATPNGLVLTAQEIYGKEG